MVNYLRPATLAGVIRRLTPPGCCLFCGAGSEPGIDVCTGCRPELPWLEPGCIHCAVPLPDPDVSPVCGDCLQQPPAFQRTEAGWHYRPPVSRVIAAYKYRRRLHYGRSLALLMAEQLVQAYGEDELPDLVTAVPLHRWRLIRRGFNQSELVARLLASELRLPYRPLLRRKRATPAQQSLDARQRRNNLKQAFHCRMPLNGQCIALVDDVVTTGATADEISRTLLAAGAGAVHLWCLARTPE